jgi:hypothetical protein
VDDNGSGVSFFSVNLDKHPSVLASLFDGSLCVEMEVASCVIITRVVIHIRFTRQKDNYPLC